MAKYLSVLMQSIVVVMAVLGITRTAMAQATPNDVYAAVEGVNRLAAEFLAADYLDPADYDRQIEPMLLRARHVYRKAQQVHRSAAELATTLGRDVVPAPDAVNETGIVPADTLGVVAAVQGTMAGLADLYLVSGTGAPVTLPEGSSYTPIDVYQALVRLDARLLALGVRGVRASDVYALALMVEQEFRAIRVGLGKSDFSMNETTPSGPVGRSDVYAAALALQDALINMAVRRPKTMPPDGFLMLPPAQGAISPNQVTEALQTLLAEVTAMRQTAGIAARDVEIPRQIGKTPADVVARLQIVITLIGMS